MLLIVLFFSGHPLTAPSLLQYQLQELVPARHTIHILAATARVKGGLHICWLWEEGNWFTVRGWSISCKLCYQECSEMFCCNAPLRTHDTHLFLEQEVNDLRFYLMHTRPVSHASSSGRWTLTPYSATPLWWDAWWWCQFQMAAHSDVHPPAGASNSPWLQSPSSPEKILLL